MNLRKHNGKSVETNRCPDSPFVVWRQFGRAVHLNLAFSAAVVQLCSMPEKEFKIAGSEIKPLAEGYGGCFATDMITVE